MSRYSQNFLINPKIADYIVKEAEIKPNDIVLEIGPGKGILTGKLLEKCEVYAIEIDKTLCEYLNIIFQDDIKDGRLHLICGDALKVNFPKFNKIVANIPYHISSPLLFKILEYEFERGILMLQYEFAERLVAKPGSKRYGRLSVMMYYNGEARILKRVKRGNFRPVPRVDSAIVKITKKDRFCYDKDKLNEFVRKLFEQRRKKIRNILGEVPYGDRRVEELSPEEICEVVQYADRIRN
ncbi:16S rRNA (adenine(1518)-N(6)/adenine(1519)-N(6))-dimethyltransferase RsmA [Candidatus Aciduliprofundum boonei]|nr:16S rRNA (adenine(1518)-N(6)/adenine(1519)-N(6))-dimethyltransferase RsmA [Candidatus Aciduliprofundum boonei]EDY37061.1 dimethyladenosine transferase [Aciduliprofundum boonei T469]HII55750.1 ribosomal RNA small subunit methyltransferase A [Candidatus Aciduliprofundum boonei]